jgi:ribosomal protein RSM22 (predicted rRNA methylase)
MTLPQRFQGAIAAWLARHAPGGRRDGSAALSAAYRAGGTSGSIDFASYLVARLPATYAAVARVLDEVRALCPDFEPESVLDAGSGPGTASWAAAEAWPGLERVTFLDSTQSFLRLAAELALAGPAPLSRAEAVSASIETMQEGLRADLVVAGYALAELPLGLIREAAGRLWAASRAMLVIVEPGTPQGFARIRIARETLLADGAVPVAPCTHAMACPMADGDWCHFSVRLARSRAHMHAKAASVPFEDERFAYLVVAREGEPSGLARIIAPPRHEKPGSTFRLCTAGRIETRHVARRDKAAYKRARKLDWGDIIGPSGTGEDRS